jgi:polyhydroxyalkanoate synthesis regulator phasin
LIKDNNMGLWKNIFGQSSTIEKQIEKLYIEMFHTKRGMSFSEARDTVRTMLEQAKKDSEKEGTANLPQNFGDILLEKEVIDEKIKSKLAKLRKEGVTDKDIKLWWNMHDLERRMQQQDDFVSQFALFLKLREEGLDEKEAAKRVAKRFPIFGDPDDTTLGSKDDSPIPYELKDRVNIYIQKRSMTDSEEFKKAIEYSTSVNSLIRKAIQKGKL